MAVVNVPGWIGQSVVDETGERSMIDAAPILGLTVPFWMSSMAGKSAYNLKFTVYDRMYNDARYRGQWGVGWYSPFSKPSGYAAVEGNFEGRLLGSCVSCQDFPQISVITIQNGPQIRLRITFADGKWFNFNSDGRMEGGYRQYQAEDAGGWYSYLTTKGGQVLEGIISRI